MRLFKALLFPLLTLFVYIALVATVFFGTWSIENISTTIGLQIILFVFLPLSIIIFNKQTIQRLIIVVCAVGSLISLWALIFLNIQHSIFLALSHLTIAGFFLSRYYHLGATKKWYYWSTAQQGSWIISILLALTYTTTIRFAGWAFQLQCDTLEKESAGFIQQFIPSLSTNETISNWISTINDIGSQTFWQRLGTDHIMDTQYTQKIDPTTEQEHWGIISQLLQKQQSLLSSLINNQHIINEQICTITLEHINKLAQNNDIQLIVFIFLTLLLYVFMKSVSFIISIINYILLIILITTGRFKKVTHTGTVEDITI